MLEGALRDDLDGTRRAQRGVLDPLKLIIDNYPEGQTEECCGAGASEAARTGPPHVPVLARTVDRARRLHRDAAQGLFPACSRATRCA